MKYICKRCDPQNPCIFSHMKTGYKPEFCPITGATETKWKISKIDREDLPDWCKEGEWVFDRSIMQYSTINEDDMTTHKKIVAGDIAQGVLIQARMRPWTFVDIPVLPFEIKGKNGNLKTFVSMACENKVRLGADTQFVDNKELMDGFLMIDGSPCGVLEHLEDGEWVK